MELATATSTSRIQLWLVARWARRGLRLSTWSLFRRTQNTILAPFGRLEQLAETGIGSQFSQHGVELQVGISAVVLIDGGLQHA